MRAGGDRPGCATNQESTEPFSQTGGADEDAVGSPFFRDLDQNFFGIAFCQVAIARRLHRKIYTDRNPRELGRLLSLMALIEQNFAIADENTQIFAG